MKKCGYGEPCFVDGEKAWGHWGPVMCLHLSESEEDNSGLCLLTREAICPYFTPEERNELEKSMATK